MKSERVIQRDLERIRKQPTFKRQEDAVEAALKKISSKEDCPEIWQEPDNGKYVMANSEAFEALCRNGYKKILSTGILCGLLELEKR